ncbi:MAG: GNAT family N-acetyltransferase [Planctomycetaceae bacterium]|nr:GNAT family N-acetyltransferase [Planctomycetaceae bacterium]
MTIVSGLADTALAAVAVPPTLPVSSNRNSELSVTLIDSSASWQACAADWDELTLRHPLHGQAWLRSWWEEYGQHQGQLAILRIDHMGHCVGFAPLFVERTWKGTALRFLGSGTTCTDYLDIFCRPEWSVRIGQALGKWIASSSCHSLFGRIDLIELEGHQANAAGVTALQDALAQSGWTEEIASLESCWVVSFPRTWDEYLQALSHRGRRRARNAMKNLHSGLMSYHAWHEHDEIVANWQVFVELHQKRRHQKGEPGCFAEGHFESFLRRAAFRLAEQGQASLVALRLDNKFIAAALQLHTENRTCLYQTGMDSNYIKLEPGHVINAIMLESCQAKGIGQFDFLRGNEPYKARWNAFATPLVRTRLWNPRLTTQVRARMVAMGRCVKQWFSTETETRNKEQE